MAMVPSATPQRIPRDAVLLEKAHSAHPETKDGAIVISLKALALVLAEGGVDGSSILRSELRGVPVTLHDLIDVHEVVGIQGELELKVVEDFLQAALFPTQAAEEARQSPSSLSDSSQFPSTC